MAHKRLKTTVLASTLAVALVVSVSAQAQSQLEEVVVTATKAPQSLQNVAMTIDVTSGVELEQFRTEDLKGLSDSVPNFVVSTGLTATNVSMRGLGSGQERSFEQAVGMFIDGQYMPRNRQYRSPFFDVERVEVVKGPQAVYFGLNSTAGAVSIITRKTQPGDGFSANITADADLEYGGGSVDGAIGFGGERAGFRLAAKVVDTEGYFRNSLTDVEDIGGEESTLLRGSMVFAVTDGFTLSAKVEYSDYEVDGNIGEIFDDPANREVEAVLGENDGVLNWVRSSDGTNFGPGNTAGFLPKSEAGQFAESTNLQLTGDLAVGEGSITATVGQSDFDYVLMVDLDTGYLNQLDSAIEEEYEQTSFDIRYQSDPDQSMRFMLGAYYHDTNFFNAQPNIWGQGFPWNGLIAGALGQPTADALYPPDSLLNSGSLYDLSTEMTSAYATLGFDIGDSFVVNLGARWVEETKDLQRGLECEFSSLDGTTTFDPASAATLGALGACPSALLADINRSRTSDNVMPEASIQWNTSDDVMFFAKVGESAKAGGFASSSSIDPNFLEYDDESVFGFELGMKSTLMDGRAQFNATLFYADFDDLQVNSFVINPDNGLPQAVLENAAKAISQGIEIEGRIAVSDSLEFGGSVGFLDATYDDFPSAPCNRAKTADPGMQDGELPGTCDFSNSDLPYAPSYSGNVYVDLNHEFGNNLALIGGVKVSFSDSYFTDGTLEVPGVQDSWTKIDARIGIASTRSNWELSLIGTNLTDEKVIGASQALLGYMLGYLEPPRGLALRFKWHTN